MKIAIIGTGISGLVVAYLLSQDHELTVFETNNYIGGHTNTSHLKMEDGDYAIDTGFIVYNDWTYPNFIKLLDLLNVESLDTEMSFSVKNELNGLEYNGNTINTLFAQRSNLIRPSFYRMLLNIIRFNKESLELLESNNNLVTLGEYLKEKKYSNEFINYYIIPMGAAIWSAKPDAMNAFPARYFIQFFKNHGLLNIINRPQWRVIKGGSYKYIEPMVRNFKDQIHLKTPIETIKRHSDHVEIKPKGQESQTFDQVVIATHSDHALKMLDDPTDQERAILKQFPYQDNTAVLHRDTSLMPTRKLAWASWNYHVTGVKQELATLSYNMNILQRIQSSHDFIVTLNRTNQIDSSKILEQIEYSHPVYTSSGVDIQNKQDEINGDHHTFYCGAYWGYGFHEDGVNSALNVCKHFGKSLSESC